MNRPKSCSTCDKVMLSGELHTDAEMIMAFDNDEERFVHVFVCPGCGQVRLIVDYLTDVEA